VLHLALRGARISLTKKMLRAEEGAMLERIAIFLKLIVYKKKSISICLTNFGEGQSCFQLHFCPIFQHF
jgi:uncharacterized metal-binding protein